MALYNVVTGNTINAADLNQVVNFVQPQAGAQVAGQYFLACFTTVTGQFVGLWITLAQRNSVPVSVTLSSTSTPGTLGAQTTGHLLPDGFQVYAQSNASNTNASFSASWTVQY